jgi:muramidase (phage lysozyme)
LSGGGTVDREHHDGSEGNVVGGESGLDGKMQYKIAPQALAEMDPVQQQIVKGIYGPESGSRYNVLNGGEEFDPSQGHPNRVGKGGQSTAAGAGQFINETWNRVTGGAPMTPAYQDAATLKLANDDYKTRTGRDLQQDVSEKGFSPEIKSALAPTWTSLGQKQSPKEDNNPLAGLGKMFGIGSAQAQEPQQQSNQQGGLLPQTGLFSEQTVIPLLSGLGAMASSRSPYLGAALLQGLGGGAKAYEDVRTQQMERQALSPVISQRNIATTNTLQTGLMQYNAMRDANGQPPISMQEFAKLSGYQGALPSDAQAVTGQTGVFGQPSAAGATPTGGGDQSKVGLAPAPTLQQMHSGTVVRDGVEIPLGNDPASLQAFVNKYKGVGGAGSFLEGQVKAYEDRLNDINASKLTRDVNGSSIPAMGVLAASRKAALAENVTKNIQSQYNDSTDFEKNYQFNNQLIDNIAEYSRLANMNRATPELAEAIGRLSSIPGFDKYITSDMATLQKANDSGTKSAVISALQTLAENSGSAQKSVLQEALHAVATPGINPGSRHDIVANAKAKLEQQHDLYQAWLAAGEKNNGQYPEPVSFTSQFNQTKPLKDYLEKAKKDIPAFAGQAQTEGNRTVVRTGVMQDGPNAGKKVIQYSDGSTEVQ